MWNQKTEVTKILLNEKFALQLNFKSINTVESYMLPQNITHQHIKYLKLKEFKTIKMAEEGSLL